MIIYLGYPLPNISSNPPESRSGQSVAFVSVLLRMGVTCAPSVTSGAVVSYTALPPLPPGQSPWAAVHFCCTILGVTSTGRYPASCPVKPGLSSPRTHEKSRARAAIICSANPCSYYNSFFRTVQEVFRITCDAFSYDSFSCRIPHIQYFPVWHFHI